VTNSTSAVVRSLIQDPIGNYPAATVACFDPTTGDLPRRKLDHAATHEFLRKLIVAGAPLRQRFSACQALLIGASTGQAHLRTPQELAEWFQVAAAGDWDNVVKVALLRPEDGVEENKRLLDLLAQLGYAVVFARPGNNLGSNPSDEQIAANMRPIVAGAAKRGLAVGLYSISDVSGCAMSPDVAADLVAGQGGDNIVAIKVTEASYENSTLRFLDDPRLAHLKIVQGWDPHLARALQDGPRHDITRRQRCGFTSGPMSFAIANYLHILEDSSKGDWAAVERHQAVVSHVFAAMQDDPGKFADLQRAKVIMGLGQPLTREVNGEQIERVFAALTQVPASRERVALLQSFDLMQAGPYHDRLQSLLTS
jgi:dihydrodipicolinate synthase/N-acetylneuraminate lyase